MKKKKEWIITAIILIIIPLLFFLYLKGSVMIKKEKDIQNAVFSKEVIPDPIWENMQNYTCKKDSCTKKREDLSFLQVSYINFDGNIKVGEIICDVRISDDLLSIFKELFHAKYQFEKINRIDIYKGSDLLSMKDNNTSAFNFRYIEGTNKLSLHAEGLAIDVNPLYNPQVLESGSVLPEEGKDYINRSQRQNHMIDKDDLAYKLFIEHGFSWGGDWENNKDYQHFYKTFE